jgi:Alginate export
MIRGTRSRRRPFSIAFIVVLVLVAFGRAPASSAQYQYPQSSTTIFDQYKDYPQLRGETQPLTEHALPSWMILDGELRSRTEDQTAISLLPGQGKFYELERIRGGMRLRPTSWLSAYVQFHDLHALGLPLEYTAANMRDAFDFRQAYVDFHHKPFHFFAGRQLLNFGNERVIGISDWTQTSRSFDGFDMRIGDKNRVDLFSASVVNIYPTSLDMHAGGLNYHGLYGSINSWVPRTTVEPFVLVKAMPRVLSQQNTYGTETEVTTGLRVQGFPGSSIDYDVTGTLQRGSYSNDSIHAGSLLLKAGYMAAPLPWKPHLLGEYDYATGNSHRNLNRIGTFDQQYPSNHNAFGLVDLFGFQNIKQRRLNLDLEPYRQLTLLFQAESLHVATRADGLYSGAGALFVKAPSAGFTSNDIGAGFDASAKYVYHKYFVVQAGAGHFFPGAIMTHNGQGSPLTISWLQLTYRFKVN